MMFLRGFTHKGHSSSFGTRSRQPFRSSHFWHGWLYLTRDPHWANGLCQQTENLPSYRNSSFPRNQLCLCEVSKCWDQNGNTFWSQKVKQKASILNISNKVYAQTKRKSTLNIHWKDCCWTSNTLTHGKRPWCWGKLKAKREGVQRGPDS